MNVAARLRERVRRSITVDAELTCEGETLARAEARMVVLKAAAGVGS